MAPRASSTIPSAGRGAVEAQTRRFDRAPPAPMSKAMRTAPEASAMVKVLPSLVITDPLGKCRSSAATWTEPSRSTRASLAEGAAWRRGSPVHIDPGPDIEAEFSDISAAGGVDHHVVAVEAGDPAQIRVDSDDPIRRAPQDLTLGHRYDRHGAVGGPAQTRWPVVELEFGAQMAGQRQGFQGMGVEVAERKPPVMPARRLAEIEALG